MTTYKQLADRINDWVGLEHEFTPTQVALLVCAVAMDGNLQNDLDRMAAEVRKEKLVKMVKEYSDVDE